MKLRPPLVMLPLILSIAACGGGTDPGSAKDTPRMRTIGQEHVPNNPGEGDEQTAVTETSELDAPPPLPFEPAISMDPVDGSKVSIRNTTPSAEYGGKLYHFSSEENRKLFLEDPKKYVAGSLGTY